MKTASLFTLITASIVSLPLVACGSAPGADEASVAQARASLDVEGRPSQGAPSAPAADPVTDTRETWQRTCSPNDPGQLPQRYFVRPWYPGHCPKRIVNDPRLGAWKLDFKAAQNDGTKECLYAWSGEASRQDTAALADLALEREDGTLHIHPVCTATITVHPRTPSPMGASCIKCAQAIGLDLYVDGSFMPSDSLFRAHTETTGLDFLMAPGAEAAVIEGGAAALRVEDGEYVEILIPGSKAAETH